MEKELYISQENKELLLQDLCARLPYGVKVQSFDNELNESVETLYGIDADGYTYTLECDTLKNIHKPYLFPLSSMTDEQKTELNDTLIQLELKALDDEIEHHKVAEFEINFYNKNGFDYRGLIPKGLAIDATGKNI